MLDTLHLVPVSRSTAPNEWQCLQFIAVVENQGTEDAAAELTRSYPHRCRDGRPFNRQSVDKTIRTIEAWAGAPLLERGAGRKLFPTPQGREFLAAARNVVAQYRGMRGEVVEHGPPTLACLPHHAQFIAPAELKLLQQSPRGKAKVRVEYLNQHHQGDTGFHHHVVSRLRQNVYQLIIGPEVRDQMFESTKLYTARLEAMVPVEYPEHDMQLIELVQKYDVLGLPRDMRSRMLLEDRIRQSGVPDPRQHSRVVETYETAASVMRLRSGLRRISDYDLTVVVPSDVALAFKSGKEFGGHNADRFKWVPIRQIHQGRSLSLDLDVWVTVKREKAARPYLRNIVQSLRDAVAQLESDGAVGLSGECH